MTTFYQLVVWLLHWGIKCRHALNDTIEDRTELVSSLLDTMYVVNSFLLNDLDLEDNNL